MVSAAAIASWLNNGLLAAGHPTIGPLNEVLYPLQGQCPGAFIQTSKAFGVSFELVSKFVVADSTRRVPHVLPGRAFPCPMMVGTALPALVHQSFLPLLPV